MNEWGCKTTWWWLGFQLEESCFKSCMYHNCIHLFRFLLSIDIHVQRGTDDILLSRTVQVVSNLPYNITTPCLQRLLPMSALFSHLFFMIQDEVAKRLCMRKPGSSEYRAMTIVVQYFSDPQYMLKISKGVYYPQPKVDGALVDFALKSEDGKYASIDSNAFVDMVIPDFTEPGSVAIHNILVAVGGITGFCSYCCTSCVLGEPVYDPHR